MTSVMLPPSLTKVNRDTIQKLDKKQYNSVTQRHVTSTLKKVLPPNNNLSKSFSTDVFDYQHFKFPKKNKKQIEIYISKKLPKESRVIWREAISDYSSFPDTDKDKDKNKDTTKMGKSLPENNLDDLLDKLLGSTPTSESVDDQFKPFSGSGHSIVQKNKNKNNFSGDLSSIFKTGSQLYKDNEDTINKYLDMMNPEAIKDGSWLTNLGSLSYPEIGVLQKVINFTPLGFNQKDREDMDKLLSSDPNISNSVSRATAIRLAAQMMFNPDEVGRMISRGAQKMAQDTKSSFDDWVRKITGEKPPKDPELGELEDVVNNRRKNVNKEKERTKYLNKLKGIKEPDHEKFDSGGDFSDPTNKGDICISSIGTRLPHIDPSNAIGIDLSKGTKTGGEDYMSAEQLLTPPDISQYGYEESTWYEDMGNWMAKILSPGFYRPGDSKSEVLAKFKEANPDGYAQYEEAMKNYEMRKKKLKLNLDSKVDMSMHKEEVQRTFDMSRKLLEKASSLKELTSDQMEKIYDVSETLEDVLDGTSSITYDMLSRTIKAIFSEMPDDLLNDPDMGVLKFLDDQEDGLGSKFNGDVELGELSGLKVYNKKTGQTKVQIDSKETAVETKEERIERLEKNKDKQVDEAREKGVQETRIVGQSSDENTSADGKDWSNLRPHYEWGGTDKIFNKSDKEQQTSDVVNSLMKVEASGWGNGSDNVLFSDNIKRDTERYKTTYAPPPDPKMPPTTISMIYAELQKPIFLPQEAPLNNVNMLVNNDLYGQYSHFNPRIPETPYPNEMRKNVNEFPYVVDSKTEGSEYTVNKITSFTQWLRTVKE